MSVGQLASLRNDHVSNEQTIAERRHWFYQAARDFFRPVLHTSDASWKIPLTKEQGRIDMQMAYAFLAGDDADIELANKLICRAPVPEFEPIHGQKHRFGIFMTSLAAELVTRFEPLMELKTIAWCEQLIAEGNGASPGNWSADYQFHGYNDNMPAMACKALILGGQRLGRADWYDMGQWRLKQLGSLLSRHGLISEYTSPNYTPDTIHCLQVIATYARDSDTRQLATRLAQRVWLDLAVHWHPQARTLSGPFSRAYAADFNAHLSALQAMVWTLWGENVAGISPFQAITPHPGLHVMHCGDRLEHTARMCYYTSADKCCLTPEIESLFTSKPSVMSAIATTEHGNYMDSPKRVATTTMYMLPQLSMGTASSAFCGGEQTAALYITSACKPDDPMTGPVCFTRYLVDHDQPDTIKQMDWHRLNEGQGEYDSHATVTSVQYQTSALISYIPHRQQLTGSMHRQLRLAMIIPTGLHPFSEWACQTHDTTQTPTLDAQYQLDARQWFGFELGEALVAFRPLAIDVGGTLDRPYVRLHRDQRYVWFEIVNYHGQDRTFTTTQLSLMLNGMAVEVAQRDHWNSLDHWLDELGNQTQFMDYFCFSERRMRYHRQALLDRQALHLEMNHSTWTDGAAVRVINGRRAPETAWDVTGIPASSLAFLGDDEPMVPSMTLPWNNLAGAWTAHEPWAIGENGQ